MLWRKRWLWLLMTLSVGGLVGVVAWWNAVSDPKTLDYYVTSVVLSLLVSIWAAMLMEMLAQFRQIWDLQRTQRFFRQLIGINDASKEIAIVLPKFDMPLDLIWRKQMKSWPEYSGDLSSMLQTGLRTDGCTQPDLSAAASFLEMFSKIGLPSPAIIWDDEAFAKVADPASSYTVLIAIGLFSNNLVGWLNLQTHLNRLFKLDLFWVEEAGQTISASEGMIKLANHFDMRIDINEKKWTEFKIIEGQTDYGLVAKVRLTESMGEKTIFLLGGIDAEGTQRMGDFMCREWRNIMTMTDSDTQMRVDGNEFALVVDIPLDESQPIASKRWLKVAYSEYC